MSEVKTDSNNHDYDQNAEKQIIGAIIQKPSALGQINLSPDDFYYKEHARIFELVIEYLAQQKEISRETISDELNKNEKWALTQALTEPPADDIVGLANKIRELGRRRHLENTLKKTLQDFKQNKNTKKIVERLHLEIESLDTPGITTRIVTINNPRIVQTETPVYKFTVSPFNNQSTAEISISSTDLDKPASLKRHIREVLRINPVLPKQYDEFIHRLVQNAVVESEQQDASTKDTICYWIREWFNSASEAEEVDDLTQGYIKKDGARWFSVDRLLRFIADVGKMKLKRSELWIVISSYGGKKSRVFRLGDKLVRLWGLDESFFKEDQETPVAGDQLTLDKDKSNLKWLEN